MNTAPKIRPRGELKKSVATLQREGKKIGFTCGAFDLLHSGHVVYLEEAKTQCDILIVAVNTDASVREYKGEKRPILPEGERMRLVAGLEAVDYVTPMPERRPRDLLSLLRPDFYFKGGDYAVSELTSKDILEEWGGKAVVLPLVEGRSTSTIIDRILQRETTSTLPFRSDVHKAVFLDRDGTINVDVPFLHDPDKFKLLPNAAEGMKRMQEMGYRLIVITNQQGIGLGYFPEEDFFRVNSAMFRALGPRGVSISRIYFCPHSEADNCRCRKPGTGLVERATTELNLDVGHCYFIGDKSLDIETGRAAGCRTILIGSREKVDGSAQPDFHAADLLEAADIISGDER